MSAHERERLSAYLDGELPAGEHALVEAHLEACSECATLLAELEAADRAAAALPVEAPDGYFDGFAGRVAERIEARTAATRPRRLPAWTLAAAAALLLGVVTPLTLRQLRPEPAAAPVAKPAGSLARESAERTPAAGAPEPQRKAALASPASPSRPVLPEVAAAPTRPPGEPPSPLPGKQDETRAQNAFAREPAAPLLPAAVAVGVEQPEAMADAAIAQASPGAAAVAPPAAQGKGGPDRLRAEASEVETAPPARSAEATSVADARDAASPERGFRRLGAVRPRSAEEWRRLRDDWAAFVAAHPDDPRADEARVRAIEAGHRAWLTAGDPDDEAAFRKDARGYLERADARQAERVQQLLLSRGP